MDIRNKNSFVMNRTADHTALPAFPSTSSKHTTPAAAEEGPIASTSKESPRELRNRAEKQRRDKLNQSISLLATIVPPVVAMPRKIDKTTIMRLTAHYLRSHQYVFGDAIEEGHPFKASSTHAVLSLIKGFVLTITYRGIVVVVSPNIRQFLGYSELDLIGTNVYAIVHDDDHKTLREQLMPRTCMLGKYGELLIPDEPDGMRNIALTLARERRSFVLRFKRLGHRSELAKYVTCHVEGSLRKSDRACRVYNRCCHIVRRARARGENPRSSGNDIVFVGVVRPTTESFFSEGIMESFRMEYRTRHSVDGEIIQCEQRIALVTGYMTQEVSGINAMNFMHRDDVRWVVIALREMYEQHRLFGESCYRLMTKNGEFVYMRTRGRLDVDENSKIAKSFVCTNTVVSEEEGKFFIDQMKKRFNILVNNCPDSLLADREGSEPYEENSIPVEDPRQLEKVILHLVTNLPSPESSDFGDKASAGSGDGCHRISIIAPKKERIVNAIKNITHVFYPRIRKMKNKNDQDKLTNKNNTSNIENKNTMENTHHSRPGAFSMSETSGKKVVISSNSNNCQTISHDTQNNGLSQSCNLPPPQQSMLASTQSYMPTVQSAETSLANARYIQVDYTQPQIYAIYDGYGRLINYQQPTSSHVNGSPFLQQQSNQGGLIGSQMFAAHPQNVGTAFGMPTTASQAFYMLQSNISNETPQQQNYFGYVTQFPSTHIDGRSLPSTSTRNAGEMPVFNFQEQAMPAINAHQYSPSEPSNLFKEIWSIPNNENQNFDPAIDRDMCLVTRLHVDTNLLEEINTTPGTSVGSASSQSSYTGSTSVSQETSITTSTLNEDVDIQDYLESQEEPPLPEMEDELIRLNNDVPLLDGNFHVALKVNLDPNFYMKDIATPPGLENIAEDEEGPLVIDLQQESHEPSSDNQMPEETEKIDETPAVIDTDVRMIEPGPSSRSVRYQPHYFNETLLTESDNATLHSRKRPYQEDTEDTVEDDGDANNNSRSEERKPPQKPYKGKGRGKRSR
ncbi:uncharacterized protein [Epargyreus clarus]|uniref:uncharacterized protein isoform X2 n=1 Tax=Epargyreus clarus TaxID=520877 RepID=UPI003C2CCB29